MTRFLAASFALHAALLAAFWLWPERERPPEIVIWATPLELAEAGEENAPTAPAAAPPAPPAVAEAPPLPPPAAPPPAAPAPPAPPLAAPAPPPPLPDLPRAERLAEADLPPPPPPAATPPAPRLAEPPPAPPLAEAPPPAPRPAEAPPAPPPPFAEAPPPLAEAPPAELAEALPLPPPPPPGAPLRLAAAPGTGVNLRAGLGGAPPGETRDARPLDRACANAIEYPPEALRRGIAGTVRLALRIGDDGRVVATEVLESSGFRMLDDAARRGVERCRFEPALRDGMPIFGASPWRITFVPPR
jgi:periplasmic protein TonB